MMLPRKVRFSPLVVLFVVALLIGVAYLIFSAGHAANADVNGDGKVDGGDLSILTANWGKSNQTFVQGDISGDGRVGILDLSLLAANWGANNSTGPTYYLATNGSDANPGSLAQPWKSFDASLPKLKPGDTLDIRGGTYTENVNVTNLPSGTTSRKITLQSYPGEAPVIENQVLLGNPSHWVISGLNVHWTSSSAVPGGLLVRIYGGTDWVFENADVWGSRGTAGIHVDDGPGNSMGTWTLRNNCVHDTIPTDGTNQDHLLYINTTTGGTGLIERNILYNSTNGRGIKLGPGGTTGGPTNVTIRYNTLYNNLGPANIQLSRQTSDITIDHNLMQKSDPNHQNITVDSTFSGTGNIALDNSGWESTGVLQAATGLSDGGGNVSINPSFDSIGCSGFHPGNMAAQAFGKYAP